MARGKMKTLHGLYKRMGREAFLETARYYSNHVHGSIETTVGEMESRWYDSAHTMTEAEKMVEDYNNGTRLGPHSLACVDVGQADASIKM
jgi:hypothetical protein